MEDPRSLTQDSEPPTGSRGSFGTCGRFGRSIDMPENRQGRATGSKHSVRPTIMGILAQGAGPWQCGPGLCRSKAEMSGAPGGLRAVPSVSVAPSSGTASCLRKHRWGGGQSHPHVPFCSSGLQTGCGRTTRTRTARRCRVIAVATPTGCLQPVGLARDSLVLGPTCSFEKRTF